MSRKQVFPIPAGLLNHEDRIFILYDLDNKRKFTLLTPQPITVQKAQNAWTHAVRYTATALDIPDYDAAMKMLIERHPTWMVIESLCPIIHIDLERAGEDVPDL